MKCRAVAEFLGRRIVIIFPNADGMMVWYGIVCGVSEGLRKGMGRGRLGFRKG